MFLRSSVLTLALALPFSIARADAPSQNMVHLNASAAVEVVPDVLTVQLNAVRDGPDPSQVQAQVKQALDSALADARRSAQPGLLDVRTGNFGLMPRYGRDGRISGWQGSAELLLEGTDFARVGQVAGRLSSLNIVGTSFRLSRELRAKAERDAQEQAIAQFRAKAGELARLFGFAGYGLGEVTVQGAESGVPRPRMLAMQERTVAADAPLPVEAGKTSVVVNVNGSIQLR